SFCNKIPKKPQKSHMGKGKPTAALNLVKLARKPTAPTLEWSRCGRGRMGHQRKRIVVDFPTRLESLHDDTEEQFRKAELNMEGIKILLGQPPDHTKQLQLASKAEWQARHHAFRVLGRISRGMQTRCQGDVDGPTEQLQSIYTQQASTIANGSLDSSGSEVELEAKEGPLWPLRDERAGLCEGREDSADPEDLENGRVESTGYTNSEEDAEGRDSKQQLSPLLHDLVWVSTHILSAQIFCTVPPFLPPSGFKDLMDMGMDEGKGKGMGKGDTSAGEECRRICGGQRTLIASESEMPLALAIWAGQVPPPPILPCTHGPPFPQ
ncbi:hypothetical protein BDK51DRAFT_33973, partial [Blyttiomyces helicus]